MNEEAMKEKAEAFVWALGRGDTKAMTQALSEETAQVLSAYRLSEMSQQLGWLLGELLAVEEIEAAEQGASLTVTARFAKMTARVMLSLTSEGNVAGFGFDLPQQPLPPLEPVTCADFAELPIKVGAAAQMDGLLTLPAGANRPPVVILVQGSGQSDCDETIGAQANRPFADLAHDLARQGIATIRYHKRFFQYPPTDPAEIAAITVEQEVTDDVRAAIALARADDRLDGERIFVLGHSMGGYLAPGIAASDGRLAGIIIMNGPFRPIPVILAEQKAILLAANPSLDDQQKALAQREIDQELQKLADPQPQTVVFGQPLTYWQSLERDQQTLLAQLKDTPILVLQGENDFQVDAQIELPLWREALGECRHAELKLYPGLSHLMMAAPDKRFDMAVYDQPAHVDSRVSGDIARWVLWWSAKECCPR